MTDVSVGDLLSGGYRYLLNGEPAEVTETFSRAPLSPTGQEISSCRRAPGVEMTVTAQLANGTVASFEIDWQTGDGSIFARYTLKGGELSVERRRVNGESETDVRALDAGQPILLFPLMRIFTGPVIDGLLEAGGRGTVVVPSIAEPEKIETLLCPQISERRARLLQPGAELIIDGDAVPCRLCEYTGDQYGASSKFWLADDATLLRYQWQQAPGKNWDVWLRREG